MPSYDPDALMIKMFAKQLKARLKTGGMCEQGLADFMAKTEEAIREVSDWYFDEFIDDNEK